MHKKAQSLLDFINFFPLQSVQVVRSPLDNREANSLFSIWKGERDVYGDVIVPTSVDMISVASLTSKGMVKSKFSGPTSGKRIVEITKKGKEIIRNIILHNEQSAFEKESGTIDYESIYRLMETPVVTAKSTKVASRQNLGDRWLRRMLWKSF